MTNGRSKRVALTLEQCWHRVPGGTAIAAIEIARALLTQDAIEVVGVAARHRRPPPRAWAPPVPIAQLPLPRALLYESWHALRRPPVQRAAGDVDIVHATTLAIPPRSAPLIVTVHDLAFVHHPTHFTRRGLRFFRRGLALARSEADLVLCSSRATMADLQAQGFEADRLRLIPWGVAPDLASEEQVEAVRDKYALGRPFVLWTGTIEPRKNLPGLIEAFRLLDDGFDLVLAGPEGWNVSLDALVATDRDRIKPIGFVPLQELRALYAGAAVFCYPSLLEGFGFPVLEAMVQGTPVVTSAGTSTEELARDAGVLVDPKDPRAIAAGLAQLLEDKELARRLVDAGRKRAAEYGWDRTARHLVSAYEEVIE